MLNADVKKEIYLMSDHLTPRIHKVSVSFNSLKPQKHYSMRSNNAMTWSS